MNSCEETRSLSSRSGQNCNSFSVWKLLFLRCVSDGAVVDGLADGSDGAVVDGLVDGE